MILILSDTDLKKYFTGEIMTAIESLKQAVQDLQGEDAALKTLVGGAISALEAQITTLQAQLASAATTINLDPQIQEAADAIQAEIANLKTVVPPTPTTE